MNKEKITREEKRHEEKNQEDITQEDVKTRRDQKRNWIFLNLMEFSDSCKF